MKIPINEIRRMQLLAGLLTEAEDNAEQELKGILKADYPTFVQKLGDNIKDPKFQAAIKSIADKHPIKVKEIAPPVIKLSPTQNEIDVDKSLKFPLTNAQSAAECLKGGAVAIAGKKIVTGGGGTFIIDGHHRWSQLYCINPKASIQAIDVTNITDPIAGLKATQLGIAGDIGKVPVATVKGSNLLVMDKNNLVNYVIKTITPEVVQVFVANGIGKGRSKMSGAIAKSKTANLKEAEDIETKKAIAEYIWKNVELMQQNNTPVSGAPSRNIMPQTDDATNWKDDAVNAQTVKEAKRWQQLAGIKEVTTPPAPANTPSSVKALNKAQSAATTVQTKSKDIDAINEFPGAFENWFKTLGLEPGKAGVNKAAIRNHVEKILTNLGYK
jgi:hypothetical protein